MTTPARTCVRQVVIAFFFGWFVSLFLLASVRAESAESVKPDSHAPSRGLHHREIFQPGDRILFVGDQVTQTFTYPRALAAAILSLRPDDKLRFINGGYDEATTVSALSWIDDLLQISKPEVVFIALGLNDLLTQPTSDPAIFQTHFIKSLGELVQRVKSTTGVRRVVLLGPAATQPGVAFRVDSQTVNPQLIVLSQTILQVARDQQVAYIDMTAHSQLVFEAASQTEGEPLTFDGVRPNDLGGVVLASILLHGLQVTPAELEPLAWSPLPPRKMARVRNGLAITLRAPKLEEADRSRALYQVLLEHDEAFFRAWRLAGKSYSAGGRDEALARADNVWRKVEQTTRELFSTSSGESAKGRP